MTVHDQGAALSVKSKLFLVLLSAGLLGVVSILLIDVAALIEILPIPPGTAIPPLTFGFKLLSLIQPAVLLAVAVLIGVALAPRVGLHAPAAEAAAQGASMTSALKPQIVPGILGGLLGGFAIVTVTALWKPFLPVQVLELISRFGKLLPLPTRLLYGGIFEEVLVRWGLMTLFVWGMWRLFQGKDRPRRLTFVAAIVTSSVLFGSGHLPLAFLLFSRPPAALIAFVIVANSLFGLIAGTLYWKKGLESAIVAHMVAHLVMFAATLFGAYF